MPQARLLNSDAPYQGLSDKLRIIAGYYPSSLSYAAVRSFAEKMGYDPKSGRPNPQALFANLRSVLRYMPDPVGAELIKAPWEMIREIAAQGWAAGDCDDFASFGYTLLHSLGVPAKLAVGWYGSDDAPSHIWDLIPLKGGQDLPFDLCASQFGMTKTSPVKVLTYA